MADQLAPDQPDAAYVPVVGSIVTVSHSGDPTAAPLAAIVTGPDADPEAVRVTLFPTGTVPVALRAGVYPFGYPGDGYRYAIAIPGDLLAFAGHPDGIDPADSPAIAGDSPDAPGAPDPAAA